MIRADAALAGVVGETSACGAAAERLDRIARQRTEAHRRNIQQRNVIRLRAIRTAEPHPRIQVVGEARPEGMPQKLVADGADVALGAERLVTLGGLGPFVHQITGLAVER